MKDNQAVVLASPITREHKSIAELFLEKAVALMAQEYQVKNYAVSQEYYSNSETIELKIGEKLTVLVRVSEVK